METSDEENASIDNQEGCWSLHGNKEICSRYEILEIVGSGTFSDIYRARRRSDGVIVALKEVHDIKSAASEIGALQRLNGLPNIVHLIEYFWRENEDAVLVLEYLPSDLYSVIQSAKERNTRLSESEVKAWMLQIVQGLSSCHSRNVLHRDLKPSNLLISDSGILKIADFGQARILEDIVDVPKQVHIFSAQESKQANLQEEKAIEHNDQSVPTEGQLKKFGNAILVQRDESSDDMKASGTIEHTSLSRDGSGSQDILGSRGEKSVGEFTSTVGTRWYRAPELLFGATSYGKEIDIWSLGCIFGELLTLEVMFCGSGDVDQLLKIVKILGGPNEDNWPGSSALPTYGMMQFPGLSKPDGLRSIVPNCSESAFSLLESLVCYSRASNQDMAQLKQSSYFSEDPTPVPLNELDVPPRVIMKGSFLDDWHKFNELDGDSEAEDLGDFNITYTPKGYSIKFS